MTSSAPSPLAHTLENTAVWRHTAYGILAGLRHDLNGRIGTVSGLVQLARLDGALDDETGSILDGEIARMARLSQLMGALLPDRREDAEPIQSSELVRTAAELIRVHQDLVGVECDLVVSEDVPIIGVRTSLLRALVVLFAVVARCSSRLRLELGRDDTYAVLQIGAQPASDGTVAGLDRAPDFEEAVTAARDVFEGLGGSIEEGYTGNGAAALSIRLPAMLEEVG